MRPKVITIVALASALTLSAQNIESFKDSLSRPTTDGARVVVKESQSARLALDNLAQRAKRSEFLGYRIGIFFDNSATARATAERVCEEFSEAFPSENVYMVYENPYFKVSAGDCVTQEEAVMLLSRIQRHFPKAYIMREEMEISSIVIKEVEVDSLALDSLLLVLE